MFNITYISDVKIGLQSSVYTAQESSGSIPICAEIIRGCLGREVSVQYSTQDGTAKGIHFLHEISEIIYLWFPIADGEDYYNVSGNFIFSSGSLPNENECVNVNIINNTVLERKEMFYFDLCAKDSDVDICNQSAEVYIIDDDCKYFDDR